MNQLFETYAQMRSRHERELAALHRSNRRDQFLLFGFLSVWLAFILYLPFAPSHGAVLIGLSIYTLVFIAFILSRFLK